jgi:ABC-type dipeptide/oligopeptide/nickel transport system permease subunit
VLARLLNAAVRSLAVTVVLGGILIYATGGLDSPIARGMGGIIAICFILFWVAFFFMFGPRVHKHDGGRDESDLDSAFHLSFRGRRHETDGGESEMNESEPGND